MRKIFIIFFLSFLFLGTVIAAPPAPTNLSPCNNQEVSTSPTLSWSDVGASYYEVPLYLYSPYSLVAEITTLRNSVNVSDAIEGSLEKGKQYYWYVRACDSQGSCSQSSYGCFFTTGGASTPVSGDGTPGNGTGVIDLMRDFNPLGKENIQEVIGAISSFVWKLAIAIAPVMFIIAGLLFITSGGDPGRVRTAKNLFLYTVIGLAIVLLASGLYEVIKSILGG